MIKKTCMATAGKTLLRSAGRMKPPLCKNRRRTKRERTKNEEGRRAGESREGEDGGTERREAVGLRKKEEG